MAKHLEKSPENSSEAETWFWRNSNLMCRWLGALLTPPFECFCPPEGQKLPKHDKNLQESRHSLFECVYQIWGLYIIFEAMNADKWLWPIFGCKVGQSVRIGMKLKLDVWHHPLDVYAKFKTDISQHVQKSPENFSLAGSSSNTPFQVFLSARGPKNCPTMTKISRDQDTHNISVCTKSEASIWFLRPWMQINGFDLFWAVK